jgi:hypothetical protein
MQLFRKRLQNSKIIILEVWAFGGVVFGFEAPFNGCLEIKPKGYIS